MMTEERKGQIALLLLKNQLESERFRLNPDTLRGFGDKVAKLGIPKHEAREFFEGLIREMVEHMFLRR